MLLFCERNVHLLYTFVDNLDYIVYRMNIFDFKSYKDYLKAVCQAERGGLSRLAEAGQVQKSYLSACLSGKNHLTLDHAFGMAEYLNLSDYQQDYFFVLIEKEKASTPKLKKRLEAKARDMSRESYRLKNQQRDTIIVSEAPSLEIGAYYASWLSTAIHMLTSIERFQTVASIAKRLALPQESVERSIAQLGKLDLVKKQGEKYRWNSSNLHLEDDSIWIANHHGNWRLRAVDNVQKGDSESTHYSVVQSMSEEDFEKLKRKIVQFIKEFQSIADPSDPEEAFCLNLDFFRI